MYPVLAFEHMGRTFDPATPVDASDEMVTLRPDLFKASKPRKQSATNDTTTAESE